MSTTESTSAAERPAVAGQVEREVRPLLDRLREAWADYTLTYGSGDLYGEAADHIEALKTVMVAAAEEIAAHWEAHCDAEGYGPQNLLRRLEEGLPSEYGYTAGAFDRLHTAMAVLASLWPDLRQLVDGFATGPNWTQWDASVRQRMIDFSLDHLARRE